MACFDGFFPSFFKDLVYGPYPERLQRAYPNFDSKTLSWIKKLSEDNWNARIIKEYYIELLEYGFTPRQIFCIDELFYDGKPTPRGNIKKLVEKFIEDLPQFDPELYRREVKRLLDERKQGHRLEEFLEKHDEGSDFFIEVIRDYVIDYLHLSMMR